MSGKNKKHNSIIFLTTLSVYLSISLLGAAPQVLAYAATTRDFDIQTEIEYKDDFDNKPDNETASTTKGKSNQISVNSLETYAKEVKTFVENVFSTDLVNPPLFEKDPRNFKFSLEKPAGNLFLHHSFEFETIPPAFFANDLLSKQKVWDLNSNIADSVYDGAQINAENNQVFIVTRLPRAAIDSSVQ